LQPPSARAAAKGQPSSPAQHHVEKLYLQTLNRSGFDAASFCEKDAIYVQAVRTAAWGITARPCPAEIRLSRWRRRRAHTHPARSTDKFGPDLVDRAVTTLTYVVGDETKAIAAIFAL
jgi:hypothetical protein